MVREVGTRHILPMISGQNIFPHGEGASHFMLADTCDFAEQTCHGLCELSVADLLVGFAAEAGHIPGQRCFSTRPPEIENRTRFEDYELDTVIGLQSGPVLVTIFDRRSRRTLLMKAADKSAQAVSTAIIKVLGPYRKEAHTLTFDNGKEFASHQLIDEILLTTSYFAHPYHSWERGLNENTNGLIRQYFPKRTDFSKITDEEIY